MSRDCDMALVVGEVLVVIITTMTTATTIIIITITIIILLIVTELWPVKDIAVNILMMFILHSYMLSGFVRTTWTLDSWPL